MDIASLGITVTNKGVESATKELGDLKTAAGGAEKAVEGLTTDAKKADAALGDLASEAKSTAGSLDMVARSMNDKPMARYADSISRVGKTAGVASHDLKNMQFQIVDVVQGLLTGQKPLMVFMQQGGQIGQVAATSGASIGQWAKALGLLNPYVLAAAAAVGVLAAGLFGLKDAAQKAADNSGFLKSLNLTEEEMKKLKNTSVSLGDVFHGLGTTAANLWHVIDEGNVIGKALGDTFNNVKKWVGDATKAVVQSVEIQIAAFVGGARAIGKTWKMIPEAIGDYVFQAANVTVKGIEWMVNQSISGLNAMIKMFGLEGVFGKIGNISLAGIKNPFAGKGEAFGRTFGTEFSTGVAEAMKAMDGTIGNIVDAWEKRIKVNAKDAGTATGAVMGKSTADMYKIKQDDEGDFSILGNSSIRDVQDNISKLPSVINSVSDAFRGFGQVVADAAQRSDNFWQGMVYGLDDLVRAFEAKQINKIFGMLADWAGSKAQSGGGKLWSFAADFFNPASSPSYDGGGYTGNGSRSGGIDGKGGFWAVMHPQETVTDHTKGQNGAGFDMNAAVATLATALTAHITRTSATQAGKTIGSFNRALPQRFDQMQRQGT